MILRLLLQVLVLVRLPQLLPVVVAQLPLVLALQVRPVRPLLLPLPLPQKQQKLLRK